MRILVVEDDQKVQNLTVQRIKSLNYRVIVANNGDEALRQLAEHSDIDLVFTDMVMPGQVSGYELVRIISEKYPHIGALMTSGYAEDLLGNGNLAKLGVKLLRKPYRQTELSDALQSTLKSRRGL